MIGQVALKKPSTLIALGVTAAAYDLSYKAVLDYASTQGFTLPSPAIRVKQNALVKELKAAGIWGQMDLFYNFYTDGDHRFAKINWKNPGTFSALGTGHEPTFTPLSGFAADHTASQYLSTQWTPSLHASNFTLTSNWLSFGEVAAFLQSTAFHGINSATSQLLFVLNQSPNTMDLHFSVLAGGPVVSAQFDGGPGVYQVWRESGTQVGAVKDFNSSVFGATIASTILPAFPFFVFCGNSSGSAIAFLSQSLDHFAIGGKLTLIQRAAFFNAWIAYKGSGGAGYDSSYQAVLDYAYLQGFSFPSAGVRARQNTLVIDLKAAGIWDDLDVFYNFFTDGDVNFAKINWKNPGLYSMPATTWAFTSLSGFTVNTTSVNMGYNPYFGTKYLINDASISIDISGIGPAGGYCPFSVLAVGNPATTPESRIVIYPSNAYGYWYINSIYGLGGLNLPAGFMHTQVHPTGGNKNYLNGVFFANGTGTPSVIPTTTTLYIGGEPANNAPATGVKFRMLAVGASLFGKELAFYNAWLQYRAPVMSNPDLSYKAVLDYAIAQEFLLPSIAIQEKQNALVIALKAAGVWTLMDLFYNFYTDGDANFAKINWKNPGTFQLVGGAHDPLFTPLSGFGDGLASSQKYFNTQWTPSLHAVNFTLASSWVSFGEAIPIVQPGGLGAHGANTNSQLLFIVTTSNPASTNQADIRINLNPAQALLNGTDFNGLAGVYQFWRESSTQMGGKKDGNADVLGTSPAAFALPDGPFYIFALNSSGNPGAYASERLDHFAIGAKLTATQRGQFYNAWNTYKT